MYLLRYIIPYAYYISTLLPCIYIKNLLYFWMGKRNKLYLSFLSLSFEAIYYYTYIFC